jgi:hypothetical protein
MAASAMLPSRQRSSVQLTGPIVRGGHESTVMTEPNMTESDNLGVKRGKVVSDPKTRRGRDGLIRRSRESGTRSAT